MIRVGSDERITAAATKESEEAARKERAEETEAEKRRREAVLHGGEESDEEGSAQKSSLKAHNEDDSHDSTESPTPDESSPRIRFDEDVRTGEVEPGCSIYQRRDTKGRGRGG